MDIVKMIGIEKRFGAVFANKDIDLVGKKGEIHALLGENGAGKSTLMKILWIQFTDSSSRNFLH